MFLATISERTEATADILDLISQIKTHLDRKLDNGVYTFFGAGNPDFVFGYESAREIVD